MISWHPPLQRCLACEVCLLPPPRGVRAPPCVPGSEGPRTKGCAPLPSGTCSPPPPAKQKLKSPCLCEGVAARDAFTQTRLMPTFWVSAGLPTKHRRPSAGDVWLEGRLKVHGGGLGFRVQGSRAPAHPPIGGTQGQRNPTLTGTPGRGGGGGGGGEGVAAHHLIP